MSSQPIPQITFKKSDFDDPSLGLFNLHWQNLVKAINDILGPAGGTTRLGSHLDISGNRVQNVGDPVNPHDAVSKSYADANYGAEALRPQLDVLGKAVLQSVRRLNDPNQQEQSSSFLNSLMSTAPTTNTSNVSFGSPSGGTVAVNVAAGSFQRMDGNVIPFQAFNDTVTLPTSYNISTLARSGNVVSVVTAVAHPFHAGDTVNIGSGNALSDSTFVGTFTLLTAPDNTHFTYQQFAPNANATGGVASSGGVYYYHLRKNANTLARVGPFGADTWSNRLAASVDGQTIVAVAVVTSSGGDLTQSGAGGTSPGQTRNVRLFGRL